MGVELRDGSAKASEKVSHFWLFEFVVATGEGAPDPLIRGGDRGQEAQDVHGPAEIPRLVSVDRDVEGSVDGRLRNDSLHDDLPRLTQRQLTQVADDAL